MRERPKVTDIRLLNDLTKTERDQNELVYNILRIEVF